MDGEGGVRCIVVVERAGGLKGGKRKGMVERFGFIYLSSVLTLSILSYPILSPVSPVHRQCMFWIFPSL